MPNISSLYYSIDGSYSSSNRLRTNIIISDEGKFSVCAKFKLDKIPEKAFQSPFRFIPFEGLISRFYYIKCCNENNNALVCKPDNNFKNLNDTIFLNTAPRFVVSTSKCKSITFEYEAKILSHDQILDAFNSINAIHGIKSTIKKFLNNFSTQLSNNCNINSKEYKITNKFNLLIVIHSGEKQGPSMLALSILKQIQQEKKYTPLILVLKEGPLIEEYKKFGITKCLNLEYFNHNTRKLEIERILKCLTNINMAICNSLACGIIQKELKSYNIKILTLVHELPELIEFNNIKLPAKNVAKYSDIQIYASEYVKNQFIQAFNPNSKNNIILPQGIYKQGTIKHYSEKKKCQLNLRNILDIPKNSKIILGCGTGFFVKGIDWFVRSAISVIKLDKNIHFVWLGNFSDSVNNMGKQLLIKELKVNSCLNNFHFIDFVENPSIYFAGADVMFMSSRIDSYPSVVLESFAHFTPVIAFKYAGGIQDLIINGQNGFLLDYGDTKNATTAIMRLISDKNLHQNIAETAYSYSKSQSMKQYTKKLLNIINSL